MCAHHVKLELPYFVINLQLYLIMKQFAVSRFEVL